MSKYNSQGTALVDVNTPPTNREDKISDYYVEWRYVYSDPNEPVNRENPLLLIQELVKLEK